jgi:hypothetical protein
MSPSSDNVCRGAAEASELVPKPRVCMPSSRNLTRAAFRCGLYEAQDVLLEIDSVDLICLEQGWGSRFKESWLRWPLYHDASKRLMFMNPGLQRVRLTQEYDLFVAVCQSYWDLPYINAIDIWKDHCKTSVCWIDEMWAKDIPGYKYWLHALSQFDYIFIGCRGSVDVLSNAINRPCYWLPGAVDTLRFSPYPNPPARVIDVYSIGRRWERIHDILTKAAGHGEMFYIYDSFICSNTEVFDHRQHRDLFGNVAKRSRYLTVAPAKMDDRQTGGQVEVGYRYYEGAAAGTVMIGQPPNCEAFRELFPWPEVVTQIRPDGSDVLEVLATLEAEPERISAIGRRNAVEALLRHDWAYRWKELFRIARIDPPAGLAGRECRLRELAALASALENTATAEPLR